MDKRQLHHLWTRVRRIKPWYFLIVAALFGLITIGALRSNYEHMTHLRSAVYTADQQNGDVKGALQQLQAFVTTHMNTELSTPNGVYPPIQLKYTYDRLIQSESQQAAQNNSKNSQIYNDAQKYCEEKIPVGFSGRYRIECIDSYVKSHGIANAVDLQPIPDDLYKFDFASPRWSSDLAGWSLLLSLFAVVAFVVLGLIELQLKRISR